jgi:hypothetical protein
MALTVIELAFARRSALLIFRTESDVDHRPHPNRMREPIIKRRYLSVEQGAGSSHCRPVQ